MYQKIKKIVLFSIILNVLILLFSTKVFGRTIDTNIDGIDDTLYPRNEIYDKRIARKT